MITAYHIDRRNLCTAGAVLFSDENGYSAHGREYNRPILLDDVGPFKSALIEHYFELIRAIDFPHMPSRFSCWFGSEPGSEAFKHWHTRKGFKNFPVWEVEAEAAFKADSSLLDVFSTANGQDYFNPKMMRENAQYYWQGHSLQELLKNLGYTHELAVPPPQGLPPWKVVGGSAQGCGYEPLWELVLSPPVRVVRRAAL